VWRTGERADGHLRTTVVRVVGPDKEGAEDPDEQKVVLRRQWKGTVGQTLDTLNIRRVTGATILAILREGNPLVSPPGDFMLGKGDQLLALGTTDQLAKLEQLIAAGRVD
jgi:K+/H+ antiporter YhaU regulatory subunit KhtT